MEKIIYSKYSNDRSEKYMIATDILRRGEKKIVRKRAVNQEAVSHVLAMKKHCEGLEKLVKDTNFKIDPIVDEGKDYLDFEYIEGIGFEQYLDDIYMKSCLDGLVDYVNVFFEQLDKIANVSFSDNDKFGYYFGNGEILEGYPSISVGDIDLVFQNIIIDDEGKWNIIDYEWTVDCCIPVKLLKYRALLLYIYGQSHRNNLINNNLFRIFGISNEEKNTFSMMEEHFQKIIKDNHKNLGDYYHYMGKPGTDSKKQFAHEEKTYVEIYYDTGEGFCENNKLTYNGNELHIPIMKGVKAVRIDPMSVDCMVHINSIKNNKGDEIKYSANGKALGDDSYLFITDDPNIILEDVDENTDWIDVSIDISELSLLHEKEINNLCSSVEQMNVQLSKTKTEIENVYNSASWKLTKPMRMAAGGIIKLLRGNKATSTCVDGMKYLFHNGVRSTIRRTKELYGKAKVVMDETYFMLSEEQIQLQKSTSFNYEPKISILVPLYNTPELFLREMIDSVSGQTYGNWELCLADGSDEEHSNVGTICKEYIDADNRIVYKHLEKNLGISENTNACIKMSTGDYIALFDHDDLLTQDALYEVVSRINEGDNVDVIYTDEDKYLYDSKKKSGVYVEPHYKSDFNLDLFRTNNYICHFFVVKKSIVDEVGGFRSEFDGSQDYDFILRCVEKAGKTEHIAKILYHWRIHANSTAANPQSKMYCYEAGKHAIESHLKRMNVNAKVEMTEHLGFYRVHYPIEGEPLVSIIIPNKDEKDTLKKCIDSILSKSSYNNYEIVIVENNSDTDEIFEYYDEISANEKIHVEYWRYEFNYSKINNFGISKAKGDYLLLLNNDVEIISENWIEEMLSNCQREEVGITGAKLIYNDNTVQHGGVIIGLGGIAGHAFVGLDANHPGYFGRAYVQQNLSAVTAACLMVRREVYEEVNGLEESLQVAFNDVDFCLKVRSKGYLVVMNPNVRLYHYESKTRGLENTPEKKKRFASEVQYMADHWTEILKYGDPYYNKNLTLIRGDFSVKGKDEVPPRYV